MFYIPKNTTISNSRQPSDFPTLIDVTPSESPFGSWLSWCKSVYFFEYHAVTMLLVVVLLCGVSVFFCVFWTKCFTFVLHENAG